MDLQLDTFSLSRHAGRWVSIFAGSCLLWVAPIGLKAPKLLIFVSIPSAIAGFSYCATSANQWRELGTYNNKMGILLDELENHQFGLKEQFLKERMESSYYQSVEQENGESERQVTQFPHNGEPHLFYRFQRVLEPVRERLNASEANGSTLNANPFQNQVEPKVEPQTNHRFTKHQLSAEDTIAIVAGLINQGFSKKDILKQLWSVSKGGSKRYKEASDEYDYFVRLINTK